MGWKHHLQHFPGALPPNAQELRLNLSMFWSKRHLRFDFELPILRPRMQVVTFPPAHQGPIFPLNCATVIMTRRSCWATHRLIFLSVQRNFNGSQSRLLKMRPIHIFLRQVCTTNPLAAYTIWNIHSGSLMRAGTFYESILSQRTAWVLANRVAAEIAAA